MWTVDSCFFWSWIKTQSIVMLTFNTIVSLCLYIISILYPETFLNDCGTNQKLLIIIASLYLQKINAQEVKKEEKSDMLCFFKRLFNITYTFFQ